LAPAGVARAAGCGGSQPPLTFTESGTSLSGASAAGSKIKHIVYIVQERRSFDSDNGDCGGGYGPSWVAALVNTVGKSKFWDSTANVPPPYKNFDGLGQLAAADKRATSPAADCFDFSQKPRLFVPIKAPKGTNFFLHQRS
jgi:phospholipase C